MHKLKLKNKQPPPRYEPTLQPVNGIVQPPVIPPPNRPGRRTNVLEDLKSMLNFIWRSRCSYHFRHPVDAVSLGVPDYHAVVKHPMDLSTIRKRLHNNYYWQASEALEDFKLIFENCMMYNLEGSPVYQAGKDLKEAFNTRLASIDLNKEVELKPKSEKRKRKATDSLDPGTSPVLPPPRAASNYPSHWPSGRSPWHCPSAIPGVVPPFRNFVPPNLIPSFMPDSLVNPVTSMLPISSMMNPIFKNSWELNRAVDLPPEQPAAPPVAFRPIVLPPPLTSSPIEPIMMPLPKWPTTPSAEPPAPSQPPPPKPTPPVIICYKSLDRLIEKSHSDHLLKSMVKRKRKQITWAFNQADYWRRYSQNPDYDHDREEKLDWKILQERLDSDNFESFDGFVSSVRKMFQNALRCFPEDGLVKTSVKKTNEIFEKRLPKYKELIATAKDKGRLLVASKEKDFRATETLNLKQEKVYQKTENALLPKPVVIKTEPLEAPEQEVLNTEPQDVQQKVVASTQPLDEQTNAGDQSESMASSSINV
ncbi:bromodomain-containing protein 2 [Drosophila teissieri]|uniref:bromodomain-containing protein 2 n=1 Tax=Drosophila teissieri TaxID=7243 RepID=UPI001CBA196C|nr:bromodomain-containing protein 2 [Drosophila teissieri]